MIPVTKEKLILVPAPKEKPLMQTPLVKALPKAPSIEFVKVMGSAYDYLQPNEGTSMREMARMKKTEFNFETKRQKGKMQLENYKKEF